MHKQILREVKNALREDIGTGDITSLCVPDKAYCFAEIIAREAFLLCGSDWVNQTFHVIDKNIEINWQVSEGEWVDSPQVICTIKGNTRSILSAERTALNFMQTISGTATKTYYFVRELDGLNTKLLDTRKTIPGLRFAQKYAVRIGGGVNHRYGLFDAFLIKENHIKACNGSIKNAIACARKIQNNKFIEVEVENLEQLTEAITCKPDRIMLDNFSLEQLKQAIQINTPKKCLLEASGSININNIKQIAQTGVDYISVGSITKSINAIDLSLLIKDIR